MAGHPAQAARPRRTAVVLGILALLALAAAGILWPRPGPASATDNAAEMSFGVKSGGACDDTSKPAKCEVPVGDSFTLSVSVNSLPALYHPNASEDGAGADTCNDGIDNGGDTVADIADEDCVGEKLGYIGIQTEILFGTTLTYQPTNLPEEEIVWPDSAFPLRRVLTFLGRVRHAAATAFTPPFPVSSHLGNLVEITLTCTETPSLNEILLLSYRPVEDMWPWPGAAVFAAGFKLDATTIVPARPVGTRNLDQDRDGELDTHVSGPDTGELIDYAIADALEINCVLPKPTPTPTATKTPTPTPLSLEARFDALVGKVDGLGGPPGPRNGIRAQLDTAHRLSQRGLPCASARVLGVFISRVESLSGGRIAFSDASLLIAQAESIIGQLLAGITCTPDPRFSRAGPKNVLRQ
jgi:hypothetical protein